MPKPNKAIEPGSGTAEAAALVDPVCTTVKEESYKVKLCAPGDPLPE
jgi:hypothetical protein